MAAQEDRSRQIASGSIDGLLAFCDYLVEKGYAKPGMVNPWKSAVRQVFSTVDGDEFGSIDVRSLDLEEYMSRFENMTKGKYKAESISSYRTRVRRALDAYQFFLAEGRPPSFSRSASRRSKTVEGREPARNTGMPPEAPTTPVVASLVEYPFPLKSGQLAYLRLPKQLRREDADRLNAFIRALVLDQDDVINGNTGESLSSL